MEKERISGRQQYSQDDTQPCRSCKFNIPGKPFCSRFPDKKPLTIVSLELPCIYYRLLLNPVLDGMTGLAVGEMMGRWVRTRGREIAGEALPEHGMPEASPQSTYPIGTALTIASVRGLLPRDLNVSRVGDYLADWYRQKKSSGREVDFEGYDETQQSLDRTLMGWDPLKHQGTDHSRTGTETGSGSGSLIRMLPFAYYLKDETDIDRKRRIVYDASSLTHQNSRAGTACFLFVEIAIRLIQNRDIHQAYSIFQKETVPYCRTILPMDSLGVFDRILSGELVNCTQEDISAGDHAVDTLEAAVWSLLHTDNYRDAVLRATSFGFSTDATAAVSGALAGILYGFESIPDEWEQCLYAPFRIYGAACNLYRRTYQESSKKQICSHLKKKYNLSSEEAEETYWYLQTQPDICEEYLSCIRTGEFPSMDTIEVRGYNARKIYNETFLTQIGAYNFLVYMRTNPERAFMELTAGMKRWRPVL